MEINSSCTIEERKNAYGYWLLNIFFMFVIVTVGVYDINDFYGPVTGFDDIGYWSCAYYFAHGEAISFASDLSYYAYGYGLLLAPLVGSIEDASLLFKAIIILNTLLNVGSYILLNLIGNRLAIVRDKIAISIFSFVSVSYLSLYIYSKFIYAECFLTFLFLLVVFLVIVLLENFKIWKLGLCILVSVYMYNVHQRSIAILVALGVTLLLYGFFNRDKKIVNKVFGSGVFSVLIFAGGAFVKSVIKSEVYTSHVLMDANDYAANVEKVKLLADLENLFYAILSFVEKIFYMNFSSFLIGALGVWLCVHYIVRCIQEREMNKNGFIGVFLLISWLCVIGVASVFAFGPLHTRFEIAVYGRYVEYIFPLYIFLGLNTICKNEHNLKVGSAVGFVLMILGYAAVKFQFDSSGVPFSTSWLSPATYYFFAFKENLNIGLLMILKVSLIGCSILAMHLKKCSKGTIGVLILGLLLMWGINGYKLEKRIIQSENYFYNQCHSVCEKINELEKDIYYFQIKNNRAGEMQFMCNSVNLYKFDLENINELSGMNILINAEDDVLVDQKGVKYDIIYSDKDWIILQIK